MKRILCFIISLMLALSMLVFTASADDICNNRAIPEEIRLSSGCNGGSNKQIDNVIVNIINAIILVAGIVAVIFVLVGGVNYITSAGDTGKIEKAKKTILYACIGLAICALAFAIVNFAISIIDQSTSEADCQAAGRTWKNGICE